MSTFTEVLLKTKNNQQVIPFITKDTVPVKGSSNPITSGAVESLRTKHLTLSVPDSTRPLYLNIRYTTDYSSVSQATDIIDTLSASSADKVVLFNDTEWHNASVNGISNDYANKRVIVDLAELDSTYVIYYSWYYLDLVTLEKIYVEPWVSTRLTATTSVPKHSELQDRYTPNAHTIDSITGLREALANVAHNDYQEVTIKTDAEMADINVSPGKIITFVGYSTGEVTGAVVMRFKDSEGNFGTLAPGLSANLSNDNLIIEHPASASGIISMSNVSVDEENETLIVE